MFRLRSTVAVQVSRSIAPLMSTTMFIDVFIHGWDIAKAIGHDPTLDAQLVEICYALVEPRRERYRESRGFGAGNAVDAPPGADLQTRLLAILGRRA